jgi:hypothetical protein
MSAVANQMAALRHAEAMYPHASHVFLVSSASIPTKKADDLQPKEGQSITGAQCYCDFDLEQVWYDPYECYTGPEFIQLASTHIETLIEKWEEKERYFQEWHDLYFHHRHGHAGDTPECQVNDQKEVFHTTS